MAVDHAEVQVGYVPDVDLVARVCSEEEEVVCLCLSTSTSLITGHESVFKVWSSHADNYDQWSLLHTVRTTEKGSVTCISKFPDLDCIDRYAISVNNCVAIYCAKSGVTPQLQSTFCFNCDEINQIDINSKASLICAGDDSGEIKVIDMENLCLFKTLSRQHSNICSTVKFNPRKPWEIFSGGLDCQLIRWDFSRGRPMFSVNVQATDGEGKKEAEGLTLESCMLNPPMVHSIDVLGSIHSIVCGLGNGCVSVYSNLSPKNIEAVCSASFHSASIACVCCLETPNSHLIVSGGNDGKICISQLKCDKEPTTPVKHQRKQCSRLGQAAGELALIACIKHRSKVNWIAVDSITDKIQRQGTEALVIFVADQTSAVTVYEVKFSLS